MGYQPHEGYYGQPQGYGYGGPPPKPGLSTVAKLLIVGAAAAILLIAGGVALLFFRSGGSSQAATVTVTATTSSAPAPSSSSSTSQPDKSTASSGTEEDSDQAGGGLPSKPLCRDLKAHGYSYAAADRYWKNHGQPERMDADSNGIPCETVYPASAVKAIYPDYSSSFGRNYYETPSGLLCKDLKARGFNYEEAVAYYYDEGAPSRMDADGNGIPCETVYSKAAVDAYWSGVN